MRRLFLSCACLVLLVTAVSPARAALTYRSDEGWSSGEQEPAADTAGEQLKRAQTYESEGENAKALGAYRALVKRYGESSSAPRAQLKIGELLEKLGDYNKAFDAYGVYLSKYPKGEQFDAAVEAQFRIAKMFLEGQRKKILGVPTFSSMRRAQEMFESIVKNAPYSQYAPLSQFNIGIALERQGEYAAAIDAYDTALTRYPNDPIAADAQYQIAYAQLQLARRGKNDQTAAAKARDAFEDFIARFPESEKVPQARENVKTLSGRETSDALDIGRFYEKQRKYKAAVVYYNDVIKQQPDSAESAVAKARIEELRQKIGDDALKPGPERAETGERAQARRKLQAQVDTAARPDYLGPPVVVPDEVPAPKPRPRVSTDDVVPVPPVEPSLPEQ
jgi:outer membrane protein assembly factor BamD